MPRDRRVAKYFPHHLQHASHNAGQVHAVTTSCVFVTKELDVPENCDVTSVALSLVCSSGSHTVLQHIMAAATNIISRRRNWWPFAPHSSARLCVNCLSDDEDAEDNRVVVQVLRPALLLNGEVGRLLRCSPGVATSARRSANSATSPSLLMSRPTPSMASGWATTS